MRELLTLTAYESLLIFDQVMYRKIDGVTMGSPLCPILANAFLCYFEKQWLSEYPPDILPKVFKRYVDYIFVMFLCQSHLNYMNTKHPNIKFTLSLSQVFVKQHLMVFLPTLKILCLSHTNLA